jgi:hypothetical protein
LIVNRAGDADRVYVATGDKVGIGAGREVSQVSVVSGPEATVGGAELSSPAYVVPGRDLTIGGRQQQVADSRKLATSDDQKKELKFAPSISGTGTTNRITKWLDGPSGVVGDSIITEAGGNIGFGTVNPQSILDVSSGNPLPRITLTNPGWALARLYYYQGAVCYAAFSIGTGFPTTSRPKGFRVFHSRRRWTSRCAG